MDKGSDMSCYVARLRSKIKYGLGVVVNGHILSCAHLFHYFSVDKFQCLEIHCRIPGEKAAIYYVQSLDCMLDFMVLGESPISMEANLGTASVPEMYPEIRPAQLVFPDHVDQVTFQAYFYEPDGRTVNHTTATVYRGSSALHLDHEVHTGSSGGPVFTKDHRLVGIMQGYCGDDTVQLYGVAVRIDQAATGWLRENIGGFERLRLEEIAVEEEHLWIDTCA